MKRPALFLDRDGTLTVEKGYAKNREEIALLPQVASALKRAQQAGWALVVITNQSGISRGMFTADDLQGMHEYLRELLHAQGVDLTGIYAAIDHPEKMNSNRKPSPALVFKAADDHELSLPNSYFIGDKIVDLECGERAGVKRSILVRTGYGVESEKKIRATKNPLNVWIVDTLNDAVEAILHEQAHL